MPAGYTITWVTQRHADLPHIKTGWQFVLDAERATLGTDGVATDPKAVPARYLPPILPGVHTPIL